MKERLTKNITKEVIAVDQIDLTNSEDPISQFVKGLEESEERLKTLHMKAAKSERISQLKDTQHALQILKDPNFKEATFYKDEQGKVVGFKVESDTGA